MNERRVIIGAIGGDKQKGAAQEFGRAVAQAGCILLTGGGDQDDDEVENATVHGALAAQRDKSAVARAVGILPAEGVAWDWRSPTHLLLYTGAPHNVRNVVNGVTPDVLVAFGGSRGTLAELGFAAAAGKQLFFYGGQKGGAVARLSRNLAKYFGAGSNAEHTDLYLCQPIAAFPGAWSKSWTAAEVLALITGALQTASDWRGSVQDLVQCCVQQVSVKGPLLETGFPGLPGHPEASQHFEAAIRQISGAP
ncbi:SLOG cluster 4 domain-containing protein [Cupriavidus sp. CP313]